MLAFAAAVGVHPLPCETKQLQDPCFETGAKPKREFSLTPWPRLTADASRLFHWRYPRLLFTVRSRYSMRYRSRSYIDACV